VLSQLLWWLLGSIYEIDFSYQIAKIHAETVK